MATRPDGFERGCKQFMVERSIGMFVFRGSLPLDGWFWGAAAVGWGEGFCPCCGPSGAPVDAGLTGP